MVRKGGLGRGLEALLGGESPNSDVDSLRIPINKISPNPRQPRTNFDEESLMELSSSIREHGILQPLLVTYQPDEDKYLLIAGERRLQAAQRAGLEIVPVIIRQVSDQERLELALIENLQRADLSPLEEAEAFHQLHEEFSLSHEEIALRIGKSRVAVTNTIRLLKLPPDVRQALGSREISEGHARVLLQIQDVEKQREVLRMIISHNLSVRQTEELIQNILSPQKETGKTPHSISTVKKERTPEVLEMENSIQNYLATKVALNYGAKGGSLTIYFYSDEDLNAITEKILKDTRNAHSV